MPVTLLVGRGGFELVPGEVQFFSAQGVVDSETKSLQNFCKPTKHAHVSVNNCAIVLTFFGFSA